MDRPSRGEQRRFFCRQPPARPGAPLLHGAGGEHRWHQHRRGRRPRVPRWPFRLVVGGVSGRRYNGPGALDRPQNLANCNEQRALHHGGLPRTPVRRICTRDDHGVPLDRDARTPGGPIHRNGQDLELRRGDAALGRCPHRRNRRHRLLHRRRTPHVGVGEPGAAPGAHRGIRDRGTVGSDRRRRLERLGRRGSSDDRLHEFLARRKFRLDLLGTRGPKFHRFPGVDPKGLRSGGRASDPDRCGSCGHGTSHIRDRATPLRYDRQGLRPESGRQ